ncbi:class I SAM-dependent methyltransferase [Gammaproteobacteria bacterium]|nr:class I SAM-dependent methyltransferase [Gammaproteobacteria bacterium]MDC1130951.1 class I SAM-dependent methyltransferase [Gammaproteobacteria bacterium]
MDKSFFIDPVEEEQRYLEHNNKIDDKQYRAFLSKLSEPLKEKLSLGSYGLDFGCGTGPALADMLTKDGFMVALYDPFFYPDEGVLSQQYDFITCTETAEHFYDPFKEFNALNDLLKPGGWLGVMTSFLTSDEKFENWYYRRDPTHVTFYCEKTFQVIASQRNWKCEIKSKDIVLLQKNHD